MVDILASTTGDHQIEAACDLMMKPFLYELTPLDYPAPTAAPFPSCPKEDILSSAFNMTLMGTDLQQPLNDETAVTDFIAEDLGVGQHMALADQSPESMFPGLVESEGGPAYGVYYNEYEDYSYQEWHTAIYCSRFIVTENNS
jgi:hypothetical protein